MWHAIGRRAMLLLSVVLAAGCSPSKAPPKAPRPRPANIYGPAEFDDNAQTNASVEPADLDLVFTDTRGQKLELKEFRGKKNLVLVFTRGFYGQICPYCTTQTSRLIAQYGEFARRDAEVLVAFPGDKTHLDDFLNAARKEAKAAAAVPFPIVLDEDFKAVDQLDIRGNLAKPSTYILDKDGNVRFAYVGAYDSDRPSVKAMLDQLDAIQSEQVPEKEATEQGGGKTEPEADSSLPDSVGNEPPVRAGPP